MEHEQEYESQIFITEEPAPVHAENANKAGSRNETLAKIMFAVTILLCVLLVVFAVSGIKKLSGSAEPFELPKLEQIFGEKAPEPNPGNNPEPGDYAESLPVNPDAGYFVNDDFYEEIDASELTPGLEYFYKKTGVKPFVYFFSEYPAGFEDISELAEAVYDQMIGEEYGGHLVLVWFEAYDESADIYYWIGDEAWDVLGDTGFEILDEKLYNCYEDDVTYPSYGDFISAAFEQAADEIK